MQKVKGQGSRTTNFCIRIPPELCGEGNVNISFLPSRNIRRSAGVYPMPQPLVKKQPWTCQKKYSKAQSSLDVKKLSSTGQTKESPPSGCNQPALHGNPRRLKYARWMSWEEGGGASGIRMQSSDSMVSLGSDAVHDDFDMIEMVAKANNIDVNAGRFLPGLEVRQCTLRSRPDDAAGGRPPRDPRSDILPSPREHFTWDHRMRSDQAEPHRHPACSAQNQRRTLHAGSDGADVTMPPCRLSRPPSEMLSVDFVMAWLLDGSVPARKSNVLPVIQDGKKRAQEPKLKGGRTRQGAGSSNT